ncbi:N-acyl-phosphatidylethanolamine-hydrolysing phospholipase D [Penicillium occitanis (nom. inval.)]|nr:hypothetical protein PENOC_052750 [Penicillium occitanis (nom. inval.)]PCH06009.1 N-acyl-phosphatidylethanolamine-hydrolysing phospholipase D [Penicillium occitanis (nom. inval.)]
MSSAYVVSISPPAPLNAVPESASEKSHWVYGETGEIQRFVNPWESARDFSFLEIFKAMMHHKFLSGNSNKPDTSPPTVDVVKPKFQLSRILNSQSMRAIWLGHACYYVEFPTGLRVLFDPVFEERCSPFSRFGHKRFTPKPCDISDLPIIDCVVISHSHYDHLSHASILEIQKYHPAAQFLVPKGLKKWFTDSGIPNAVELDWWEDVDITLTATNPSKETEGRITARISCLPCQHTSARTPFDKSTTLWASWAVSSGGKSVYFVGDSGYRSVPSSTKNIEDDWTLPEFADLPVCPAFKQIGDLRGPFDLGLIPIGAYRPRHVLSSVHSNPFDSVAIFKDTRCKRAMAIHWGTWAVAEEDVLEPPQLLKRALLKNGLPEKGVFDICDIGEGREF